jgi:hypothetical protein
MAYAWALHYKGQPEVAEGIFKDMDRSFTNYRHRLEYCKFLKDTNKAAALKDKLTELMEEFNHMEGSERRTYRDTIREVRDLHASYMRS